MEIQIIEFEEKKTEQNKDYLRISTNKGWMSCFEENEIQLIKENKGNVVNVETTVNGAYTNIVKFLGVVANPLIMPIGSTNSSLPVISNITPNKLNPLNDVELLFVRNLRKALRVFKGVL